MKLKYKQHILLILFLLAVMPVGIMAEEAALKISVHDVMVPKGETANVFVSVDGGCAPYNVSWFENFNKTPDASVVLNSPGQATLKLQALLTADYKVKVTDSKGATKTEIFRLIVTDYKATTAAFENLSLSPHNTTSGIYNYSSVANKVGWNKSFVSGAFVFSSMSESKKSENRAGILFSNYSYEDISEGKLPYRSAVGSGNNASKSYAVIKDSAYVSFADPSLEFRPVSGFYITNSSELKKFASQSDDFYASVSITNILNGKSVDYCLADINSKKSGCNYCLDKWSWVDLAPLHFTRGSLKFKLVIKSPDKKLSEIPHTFCIDDFNGVCNTTDLSKQMVGVNSIINLENIIPALKNISSPQISIYNIQGGYPEDASFEINDKKLKVRASNCNIRITLKVSSKYGADYYTIPVIADGMSLAAEFNEQRDLVSRDINGDAVLRSGTYVFSPDNDVRSAFYSSSDTSDNTTVLDENSYCGVMSNSGYIYNMCHDDTFSGFYVKLSDKTYNAVVNGDNIGEPYRQGDSLMLYISDIENKKHLTVPLADYRFKKETDNYCIKSWHWVDLRSLGDVNSLHLILSGSRFDLYNFVPECYIDNFGGAPKISRIDEINVLTDSQGGFTIPLDSCFGHQDDPLVRYNYELERVNEYDSLNCVTITDETLHCVSSHSKRAEVVVKSSLNGDEQYLAIPLNIVSQQQTAEAPIASDANICDEKTGETNSTNLASESKQKVTRNTAFLPAQSQTPSTSGASESNNTPSSSISKKDNVQADDSLSNISSSDTASVRVHGKQSDSETNIDNKETTEEPTDMRIVFIMLFLFVLLTLLMYMYNRRQRLNSMKELESLKKRYAESIALYDKAKDEIASLSALKQKYHDSVTVCERIQSEIDSLSGLKDKYAASVAEIASLKKQIDSLKSYQQKYSEELEKNEKSRLELESLKQLEKKYAEALAENERVKKAMDAMKLAMDKELGEEKTEIEHLKSLLSSYQDNVNPDEWNAEQSLLEHETVVKLHRDVDGAHMATEKQWNDLNGVVSKLLPDFYAALSEKSASLSDNEFKVCLLTRLKFLPTEMAVLLNLSKQRITNIRAAVNNKLFNEAGTKTFESNIFNLDNK